MGRHVDGHVLDQSGLVAAGRARGGKEVGQLVVPRAERAGLPRALLRAVENVRS